MKIYNIVAYCDDKRPQGRPINKIDTLVVHRVGVDLLTGQKVGDGRTALSVSRAFLDDPEIGKYTAMQTPYAFIVDQRGDVYQCLALSDLGQHAAAWNLRGVGIALIGDFRVEPLEFPQRAGLVDLLTDLCVCLGLNPAEAIKAHDRLEGGTHTPGKVCPGGNVDIRSIAQSVATNVRLAVERRITMSGLVA